MRSLRVQVRSRGCRDREVGSIFVSVCLSITRRAGRLGKLCRNGIALGQRALLRKWQTGVVACSAQSARTGSRTGKVRGLIQWACVVDEKWHFHDGVKPLRERWRCTRWLFPAGIAGSEKVGFPPDFSSYRAKSSVGASESNSFGAQTIQCKLGGLSETRRRLTEVLNVVCHHVKAALVRAARTELTQRQNFRLTKNGS